MARCNNAVLLKKISNEFLNQNTEIDFRIRRDLPDCKKINTKDYTDASGDVSFNRYRKPTNRFECGRKGCITTGLLTLEAANDTVTFKAPIETDYASGVVTFYVYPDAAATFPITVTVKMSETDAFTDADVYTVTVEQDMVTDDGFAPIMVNLAKAPTSVVGNGWTPSDAGAYIQLSADKIIGVSSISFYESLDDFDLEEAVTISCLTTIGGTFDLEVVEAQCQEARYNDNINTLTYPVTGTQITPNYMKLFPMLEKGGATTGFDMVTVKRTIDEAGTIVLPDANQDVCGFITVQADDSCDVTEAMFTKSNSTSVDDIDEAHYIVQKNADGTTSILFNVIQAGVEVLVRYPKQVEIEEYVANPESLNSSRVSMAVPVMQNDGTKLVYVFENVFITSFPATITTDAAEFAFTLTIGRDDDGNFFRIQRIIG